MSFFSQQAPSAGTSETVALTAHGFAVKDAIAHNGTTWVKALATTAGVVAQGIVVAVADANNFTVQTAGKATLTAHGLTVGNYYWLSQVTAGLITTTQYGSGITQSLLYVRDANIVEISIEQATAAQPPTPIGVQRFIASGTYIPTNGMKYCIVEMVGGGGSSGGAQGAASFTAYSGGGGAGGYAKVLLTAAQIAGSQAVTIGAGGAAPAAGANNGFTGGTTSLGTLVSAAGGNPSTAGTGINSPGITTQSGPGGGFTITAGIDLGSTQGEDGMPTVLGSSGSTTRMGRGGNSQFGRGGLPQVVPSGTTGSGLAAAANSGGGGGGAGANNVTANAAGGAGGSGLMIITEYFA